MMLKYDPSSRVARRKRRITVLKRIMPLYIMLIPAIVYVIVFSYYPMYGAQIAFRNFKITLGIWDSPWVGFDYFIRFFNSFNFTRIFTNTLYLSVYSLIASTVVVVSLSLILHCVLRDSFKRLVQTVIYLPHFISTVVIVGIVLRMLNPSLGVISKLIQFFGGTSRDLMGIAPAFSHIYVWSGIWQNAGYGTVIYLAALASADAEHHEAAMIDGASRLQRLIHIDIPVLIPTIVIMLIMNLGRLIDVGYEKILLMQNNLNLQRSEVIATYVYKIGLASNMPDYSLSTAVGLFNSVISLVLVVTVNTIAKKLTATSLW